MVAYAFDPSAGEVQVELCVFEAQPDLQSKFQDSQNYIERPCLKKPKKKNYSNHLTLFFIKYFFL